MIMNREIKFRGKRIDTGEWVYGYYYSECGNTYIIENRQKEDMAKRNIPFRVKADTIGQYTGLEDRNWKEIYEGDTVGYRFTDSSFVTGKVVWWGARCGFYIRTRENDYYELTEHCQVIDTFSDNPELLEEEK